jgi:hypothetical protein
MSLTIVISRTSCCFNSCHVMENTNSLAPSSNLPTKGIKYNYLATLKEKNKTVWNKTVTFYLLSVTRVMNSPARVDPKCVYCHCLFSFNWSLFDKPEKDRRKKIAITELEIKNFCRDTLHQMWYQGHTFDFHALGKYVSCHYKISASKLLEQHNWFMT